MSKTKLKRQLADNQCKATLRSFRCTPSKVNLVAGLIRNRAAADALVQLEYSRKAAAEPIRKLLQSAIANAENNHNLDIDNLFIKEVNVGKGIVMKRFAARARGRSAKIEKFFSNVTIILEQKN
ncbi:MAG TPA: 50S ribosomal protein L22 [Alphaproteobacteria bacterium]|nr:50S ribosomal protein L22 [Alphaproteobacteria bacterium]